MDVWECDPCRPLPVIHVVGVGGCARAGGRGRVCEDDKDTGLGRGDINCLAHQRKLNR